MEKSQVENLVRDVLKKVLDGEIQKPSARDNPKLARWLSDSPTSYSYVKKKAVLAKGVIQKTAQCSDKNFIPDPQKPDKVCEIVQSSPARLGVWRAGTRYLTKVALKLRADHALAKDAVYAELPKGFGQNWGWIELKTKAKDKEEFLLRPDLGRELSPESLNLVREKGTKNPDIQITVADGLSSWAAERNAKPMVDELLKLFSAAGRTVGSVFVVRFSRIAIQDVIGETLGAKVSMILLGERPGLGTGDSLSNYMIFNPKVGAVNAAKSMISNIHPAGYSPHAAAKITFEMVQKMFEQGCSGINLKV